MAEMAAKNVQFKREKHQNSTFPPRDRHCTELEPLCIIKQPLTKKLEESSASHFPISKLTSLYLLNSWSIARCTKPKIYFHAAILGAIPNFCNILR